VLKCGLYSAFSAAAASAAEIREQRAQRLRWLQVNFAAKQLAKFFELGILPCAGEAVSRLPKKKKEKWLKNKGRNGTVVSCAQWRPVC
jgi:hypothetical protein